MRKRLLVLGCATLLGALVALGGTDTPKASAANSCGNGSLCFWDSGTFTFGNVWGSNPDWGQLPGRWNDRADEFWNNHYYDTCLFGHAQYKRSWPGWYDIAPKRLRYGGYLMWSNVVSSNTLPGSGC